MVILLVDDQKDYLDVLQQALSREHTLLTCSDGVEALNLLGKAWVDVMIVDHMMPRQFGFETIVKAMKLSPSTSFILVTGMWTEAQARAAKNIGIKAYLRKPIDFNELQKVIKELETAQTAPLSVGKIG